MQLDLLDHLDHEEPQVDLAVLEDPVDPEVKVKEATMAHLELMVSQDQLAHQAGLDVRESLAAQAALEPLDHEEQQQEPREHQEDADRREMQDGMAALVIQAPPVTPVL